MKFIKRLVNRLIRNKVIRVQLRILSNHINTFFFGLNSDIEIRKSLSIFDYQVLAKPLKLVTNEWDEQSDYYGTLRNLREYSGFKKSLRIYIEHGVYFGNITPDLNRVNNIKKDLGAIVTFSPQREIHIKQKANINVIKIGPYIHYSNPLLTEGDYEKIKDDLGKTLLVFPSHSEESNRVNFNEDSLIYEIKQVAKDFASVLICMYWKDIYDNKQKVYEDAGFKIVTAGHRSDPYFLNRLKTIIFLADDTMSNSVGTHVGYCIYLNKPHYIYSQKVESNLKVNSGKGLNSDDYKLTLRKEKNEVLTLFNQYPALITDEQKVICNKYWGFGDIKTKNELLQLFQEL